MSADLKRELVGEAQAHERVQVRRWRALYELETQNRGGARPSVAGSVMVRAPPILVVRVSIWKNVAQGFHLTRSAG